MNEDIQKLVAHKDFLYHSVPDINFFIYPPMKPVIPNESLSVKGNLALDQPRLDSSLFAIYVSIPYCRSKCNSCCCFRGLLPAHVDKDSFLDDYLDCLISQIQAYSATVCFSSAQCGAVYIGGGTASVLAPYHVDFLIRILRESFNMVPNVEINLEGNPIDFSSMEYLQQLKKSGVTRLSIGYQSSQNKILKTLNTPHSAGASLVSVKNALATGFDTVNVDLLYNVPGETAEEWHYDLQTLLDLGPQNISLGDYVVFPGSKAEELISSGALEDQHDIHKAYEWYIWACEQLLEQNNYAELVRGIFCKPGHQQQYVFLSCNKSCEIIGLGAGAFSFINGYQFQNTSKTELYKEQVRSGLFFEADRLSRQATDQNLMERYIIHNFYSAFLNRQDFYHRFGQDPLTIFPQIFSKLENHSLVIIDGEEIRLTKLGKKWRRNIYYEFHSLEFK